jgi:hypothetical protein
MSPGRIAVGRARAIRALLALIAMPACLSAVAFAATPRAPGLAESKPAGVGPQPGVGAPRGRGEESLPRARLIEYPEATSVVADPQFRFHVPPRTQRPEPSQPVPLEPPGEPGQPGRPRLFQCKLDDSGWRGCSSPYRLSGVALGDHSFAVRAFNRAGRPGPAIVYSWQQANPASEQAQVDPKPFSIKLSRQLEDLFPGDPAQQVPILIANPNPVPIEVTSLTVAIAGDPPACAAENFALTRSNASPAAPLTVPANGSVSLPTATVLAPTIAMLNLAVNQDTCRGVDIPLVFSGEAHG